MNKWFSGFITVRSKSTRLPGKCFLSFGDSCTVIDYVVNRCKDGGIDPIICTTDEENDNIFVDVAKRHQCRIFRGPTKNKLKRWVMCAQNNDIREFHTVDADDPFFDPKEMRRSMEMLSMNNYSVVYPSIQSSNGAASSGYSIKTDRVAHLVNQSNEEDTEMVDAVFKRLPQEDVAVVQTDIIINARLTLDYAEDYSLLAFIARELGNNPTREKILDIFSRNPDLYKLNWFRNADWTINQQKQRKVVG